MGGGLTIPVDAALTALPLAVLAGGGIATFLVGRISRTRGGDASAAVAVVSFALAFVSFLVLFNPFAMAASYRPLGDVTLRADGLAVFLGLVATGLGFAVAVYSLVYMRAERDRPMYGSLLLLMITGIVGIGLSGDLFNLYVFFELMAIASYALVAFHRERAEAVEAGMKYIVMSGAGSIVALLGIGLIYMHAGTLDLGGIRSAGIPRELGLLAAGLLIGGFGVKAAIVPMHTWLPDAHSAAPSGISAMLSGIVIQSGLLAMVKSLAVLGVGPSGPISYGLLLAFLAVLTMTVGNLLAMHQRDIKRLLAYSSVAQMGYILLGFGVGLEYGVAIALVGSLFHILNHAMMKGGAFLVAGALERAFGTRNLDALRGAGRNVPWVGLSFGVFVLGLAGVPPTAGFLSKLFLATGAMAAGNVLGVFLVVALIANSVLSLAYYVPALTGLFSGNSPRAGGRRLSVAITGPVVALAALVLLFGLWPDLVLRFVDPAARAILGGP